MKLHFIPITLVFALALNTVWLVSEPTKVVANDRFGLSPIPFDANRIGRDLTPSLPQDLWQQRMNQEVICLLERNRTSKESFCKTEASFHNNIDIQKELKRLPQLQPHTPNPSSIEH
jgi:hypothetical protein